MYSRIGLFTVTSCSPRRRWDVRPVRDDAHHGSVTEKTTGQRQTHRPDGCTRRPIPQPVRWATNTTSRPGQFRASRTSSEPNRRVRVSLDRCRVRKRSVQVGAVVFDADGVAKGDERQLHVRDLRPGLQRADAENADPLVGVCAGPLTPGLAAGFSGFEDDEASGRSAVWTATRDSIEGRPSSRSGRRQPGTRRSRTTHAWMVPRFIPKGPFPSRQLPRAPALHTARPARPNRR